jgi:hypothetical protein
MSSESSNLVCICYEGAHAPLSLMYTSFNLARHTVLILGNGVSEFCGWGSLSEGIKQY